MPRVRPSIRRARPVGRDARVPEMRGRRAGAIVLDVGWRHHGTQPQAHCRCRAACRRKGQAREGPRAARVRAQLHQGTLRGRLTSSLRLPAGCGGRRARGRPSLAMKSSRLLPLIVACALFVENMDSTVLSTSLPAIAADLATDPIALKLALTTYLLALAVFIPVSGWVADRFGARSTFVSAIAVFLLGSVGCALSDSLGALVAGRFVQGMGGAMMVPVGRLVLLRTIPKSEIVQALSWVTIPALVGPMVGPPLGGFITTYFDWRWIFLINLPIGALGMMLALRFIPNAREEPPPFDWLGFP